MNRILSCLAILVMSSSFAGAHESSIDHVERELRLTVKDGKLRFTYRLQPTERATLMELKEMDANGNGKITDAERDAFFTRKSDTIAQLFQLKVDDESLSFVPVGKVKTDGQLGQTFTFAAPLPALKPGRHAGWLLDGYSREYPGAFHWKAPGEGGAKEIRVEALTPGTEPRSAAHPPWLELKFEIVVPE